MDFSGKQKDFCQRRTRFFGVKCPSDQTEFEIKMSFRFVYRVSHGFFQSFCKGDLDSITCSSFVFSLT